VLFAILAAIAVHHGTADAGRETPAASR